MLIRYLMVYLQISYVGVFKVDHVYQQPKHMLLLINIFLNKYIKTSTRNRLQIKYLQICKAPYKITLKHVYNTLSDFGKTSEGFRYHTFSYILKGSLCWTHKGYFIRHIRERRSYCLMIEHQATCLLLCVLNCLDKIL